MFYILAIILLIVFLSAAIKVLGSMSAALFLD